MDMTTVDRLNEIGLLDNAGYGTGATSKGKDMGKDEFLKLLVGQLQHQDPLNPLDGTDFVAQLAQFSHLEQLFNVNDTLTSIKATLDGQTSDQVLDYIGKTVKSGSNYSLMVNDGKVEGGGYTIEEAADVAIKVFDSNGFEVQHFFKSDMEPGEHAIEWDGTDAKGEGVEDGEYTYSITALDKQGKRVSVDTRFEGKVTGVTYRDGVPYLMLEDRMMTIDDVVEIKESQLL